MNLFNGIITSVTRVNILTRLLLNPNHRAYLQELAKDFSCSSSQVYYELIQLVKAKILNSERNGRCVYFFANQEHPLFPELRSMVLKAVGADAILEKIVAQLGALELVLLLDDYAVGKDTGIIDLLLVGDIDEDHLRDLRKKVEKHIKRKIRTLTLTRKEYVKMKHSLDSHPTMLLWSSREEDYPPVEDTSPGVNDLLTVPNLKTTIKHHGRGKAGV